jgi:hypothetical protein
MDDERPTGERRQRLVAAHAGRPPARQYDAGCLERQETHLLSVGQIPLRNRGIAVI